MFFCLIPKQVFSGFIIFRFVFHQIRWKLFYFKCFFAPDEMRKVLFFNVFWMVIIGHLLVSIHVHYCMEFLKLFFKNLFVFPSINSISWKSPVGKYWDIVVPYRLLLSWYASFLSARFTWKFRITDEATPRILLSSNYVSLSSRF